jgi:hypothetical protein
MLWTKLNDGIYRKNNNLPCFSWVYMLGVILSDKKICGITN